VIIARGDAKMARLLWQLQGDELSANASRASIAKENPKAFRPSLGCFE
jgi:hypothetical protein